MQSLNCNKKEIVGFFTSLQLPRGVQHMQATEKADPINKINLEEVEYQERTCKECGQTPFQLLSAPFVSTSEEQQHQQLLS